MDLRRFFLPRKTPRDEITAKVILLMHLRWLVLFAQGACVFIAARRELLDSHIVQLFFGTIGTLTAYNVFTANRILRKHQFKPVDLFLQLAIDLSAMTCILFFAGGLWNPLGSLIYLHTILGAWFLKDKLSSFVFLALIAFAIYFLGTVPEVPYSFRSGVLSKNFLYGCYAVVALVLWIGTRSSLKTLDALQLNLDHFREQKNRMDHLRGVGAIVAGFAHEFATPLNTVKMRVERALRRDSENDDLQVALEAIQQCEGTLRSLAQSRLMNASEMSLTPVHLMPLIREVCESWKGDQTDLDFTLNMQQLSNDRVMVPSVALAQSLLSLLDNAALSKMSDRACVIEMAVIELNDTLEIKITDNGEGFSDLVIEKFGEPFITTRKSGTGLGLYNALILAQALGGDLTISNLKTRGAQVSMVLPVLNQETT